MRGRKFNYLKSLLPYFIRINEFRSNKGKTIESITIRVLVFSESTKPTTTARITLIKNKIIVGTLLSCILLPPMLE